MIDLAALLAARFHAHPGGDAAPGAAALPERLWERALLGPVRDYLARPGNGVRGRLLEAGWSLAGGGDGGPPPELPALIELVHAGSLVLDDVQDGSAERRGLPALHALCGTGVAVNLGGWMILWPLHLLGLVELPGGREREAHRRVVAALVSCHQGQALDLALPVGELAPGEIADVAATSTRLRTASLTELAAVLGGLAAGAADRVVDDLGAIGRDLGTALQMLDDLGGVVAAERRAKGLEDLRLGRTTWVWAWAAEHHGAAELAALQALAREVTGGADAEPLRRRLAAVEPLGRGRARAALRRARARLDERFAAGPARDALAADLAALEGRYG